MRILFLAPSNYDYTKAIANVLLFQGHKVVLLDDKCFRFDPFLSYGNVAKRYVKYLVGRTSQKKSQYWRSVFNDNEELNTEFDLFLCINGYSLCDTFFFLLQGRSPNVRKVYYLWDSCNLYAFYKNFHFFDRCVTFDFDDAEKYIIKYLPMFWIPEEVAPPKEISVFFVGTIHSDRYQVLVKLIEQLVLLKIPYYIKLYIPNKHGLLFTMRYYLQRVLGIRNVDTDIYDILHHKVPCDFSISDHISLSEFNSRLSKATHIIDIEQPFQKAITPRVIQALACNKRIITTNTWLKESSFYTPSQIFIINREDPKLTADFFIDIENVGSAPTCIQNLRIDNWAASLLGE